METVGSRIRTVRTEKGLTLEQLAAKSKLSKSFLWDVEHDRSDIGGENLLRIADVLGASLDFLLRGEPAPKKYTARPVEIPRELHDFAEEAGLTYRQTLALLDVHRAILARRRKKRPAMTKSDWKALWEKLRSELENQ